MIALLLSSFLSLSWYPHEWVGLITDDYGIVTVYDLIEEEERCLDVQPFSVTKEVGCFQYWQCLPTDQVFMACEELEPDIDAGFPESRGIPIFRIKDGDITHYFYTRRIWALETCYSWIEAWTELMIDEPIVCISGEFSGVDYEPPSLDEAFQEYPEEHSSKYYWWQIDRMKSPRGEWSYFERSSY